MDISNNFISGTVQIYGAYTLFEGNEVDGTLNDGFLGSGVWDAYPVSHHNIFRNNNVHNFFHRGIWTMIHTHDNLFENNIVHDIGWACIDLMHIKKSNIAILSETILSIIAESASIWKMFLLALIENNLIHNTSEAGNKNH